ncbi:MAG: amidohydrolase family protein [Planctomycetota bacterium]
MRAIDVHLHMQPWASFAPRIREAMGQTPAEAARIDGFAADPAGFAAWLDGEGFDRVLVVNYPAPEVMGFGMELNDWAHAFRAAAPERFWIAGGVDLRRHPDPDAAIARLLDEQRVDAVKVHPPHQGHAANAYLDGLDGLARLYAACQDRGVPVIVHTGTSVFPGARGKFGDPMACDDVAVDFPALRLLLAHAGRPLWMETCVHLVRRHPNVHLDVSGIPPSRLPRYLPGLERIADKALFGTDWPSPGITSPRANLERFLELPMSEEARARILRTNALALFGRR